MAKGIFTAKLQIARIALTSAAAVAVAGLWFVTPLHTQEQEHLDPTFDYQILLTPQFGVDTDLLSCLQKTEILHTQISSPANNTQYKFGNKVSLKGNYQYDCKDLDLNTLQINWYLDSQTKPFNTDSLTPTLSSLSAGTHKVTLSIKLNDSQGEAAINIKILPNNPPTVSIIRPKDNSTFNGYYTSTSKPNCNKFSTCALVPVYGSGSDIEDGTPQLSWYWVSPKGDQFVANGTSTTVELPSYNCQTTTETIKLIGKDSQGATASTSIRINVVGSCIIF